MERATVRAGGGLGGGGVRFLDRGGAEGVAEIEDGGAVHAEGGVRRAGIGSNLG